MKRASYVSGCRIQTTLRGRELLHCHLPYQNLLELIQREQREIGNLKVEIKA
jgi:hypothetical protein